MEGSTCSIPCLDDFSETNTFFSLLLGIKMGTMLLESDLELFIKT